MRGCGRRDDRVRCRLKRCAARFEGLRAEAVRERSGGGTVAVSEDEIRAALRRLASIGLYVEPTCAGSAAAASRLLADGRIRQGETTVVLLTGTGLKASAFMTEFFGAA